MSDEIEDRGHEDCSVCDKARKLRDDDPEQVGWYATLACWDEREGLSMSIKRTVKQIRLETIDDVEYVDVTFLDDSELRLKGPRSGLKIDERVEDGRLLTDVEFDGFELV